MKEEFFLDFDHEKTEDFSRGIEIAVQMRVNGREMLQNISFYPLKDNISLEKRDFLYVYPEEFASWIYRLVPRIMQPYPRKPRAIQKWRMTHKMAAIGCGIIWPNILFSGRNDLVFINEKPFIYSLSDNVSICGYIECITTVVSKRCFIDGVKAFLDKVEKLL